MEELVLHTQVQRLAVRGVLGVGGDAVDRAGVPQQRLQAATQPDTEPAGQRRALQDRQVVVDQLLSGVLAFLRRVEDPLSADLLRGVPLRLLGERQRTVRLHPEHDGRLAGLARLQQRHVPVRQRLGARSTSSATSTEYRCAGIIGMPSWAEIRAIDVP
nr:hypothetical protein [Micromonospora pallida]